MRTTHLHQWKTRVLYGLSCRKSSPRQQRHSSMNDILWRAVGADSGNKGTGEFDSAKWETPRRKHMFQGE